MTEAGQMHTLQELQLQLADACFESGVIEIRLAVGRALAAAGMRDAALGAMTIEVARPAAVTNAALRAALAKATATESK